MERNKPGIVFDAHNIQKNILFLLILSIHILILVLLTGLLGSAGLNTQKNVYANQATEAGAFENDEPIQLYATKEAS